MRRAADIVVAAAVAAVFVVCAFAIFRGVTEAGASSFDVTNRTAMVLAWWIVFVGVPAVLTVDLALHDQADFWAAHRSKTAWLALLWMVPFFGPMLYAVVVRWQVGGAYDAWRRTAAR